MQKLDLFDSLYRSYEYQYYYNLHGAIKSSNKAFSAER